MTITGLAQRLARRQPAPALARAARQRRRAAHRRRRSGSSTTTDRELPAGEIGEIVTRQRLRDGGLLEQHPEANAEDAARRLAAAPATSAAIDADGFLTLKDRSKDMIISGGANIYPREIEEVLLRHPGGAARPRWSAARTAEWGEEVVAFVVATPDAQVAAASSTGSASTTSPASSGRKDYRFVDSAAEEQLRQDPQDRAARPY